MDATSGAVRGKRQASSIELMDTQQAESMRSQPLSTHIPTASEATLRTSVAAPTAFPIVSQTLSAPYDTSTVQHPFFSGDWTHPYMHMNYNNQTPSPSYFPTSQMALIPGTASAAPYFSGTLTQPNNTHNQPSPFFHPFLFNTHIPPVSSTALEMPNPVTLQLQIQSLQQQLQANQEELLRLKTKDTPMAPSQSGSTTRKADLSHHGISPDGGINLSTPGDGEHEQRMELPSNARTDRDLHHRSTNKRVATRSKPSAKDISTSSSSASRPPSGKHPSLHDKMRSLEAQVAKIKRQQEDNDDIDSEAEPLHPSLKTLVVPSNTKMYKGKYDGQTDPSDHVASFVSHYDMHGVSDQLKCRIFPSTLTGPARRWYTGLGDASIKNFKSL